MFENLKGIIGDLKLAWADRQLARRTKNKTREVSSCTHCNGEQEGQCDYCGNKRLPISEELDCKNCVVHNRIEQDGEQCQFNQQHGFCRTTEEKLFYSFL